MSNIGRNHLDISVRLSVCGDPEASVHTVCLDCEQKEWSTLVGPASQRTLVVDGVVEGEGEDEEGALAGRVHAEGHILLVQTHRLSLLRHTRLEKLPCHLEKPHSLHLSAENSQYFTSKT